jgi:CRISPR/Cas system CMR-associated protein Cmr5 small subunit
MLTWLNVASIVAAVFALILSGIAFLASKAAIRKTDELAPLKEKLDKFDNFDESIVRSVMEEGGDASVEAVLETVERLMESDDGSIGAADALKAAREMHKR